MPRGQLTRQCVLLSVELQFLEQHVRAPLDIVN